MGTFLDLLSAQRVDDYHKTVDAIAAAILASYRHTKSERTDRETKRRFALCERFVSEMTTDQEWSLTRALDEVPGYLNAKLDGVDWTPSERGSWVAEQKPLIGVIDPALVDVKRVIG